jgi:ABC-2 type transport system permease protein
VPFSWFVLNPIGSNSVLTSVPDLKSAQLSASWRQLTTANLWIGVAAGSAMIYAAIRIRRWKDEG